MDAIRWERKPELRDPILICAFKGWNDAAESATLALSTLDDQWHAERVATIDPEEYFDFQMTRPTVRLIDGRTREIEWPETVLSAGSMGEERDVVLLAGLEPNLRWRGFCETIVEAALQLKVQTIVSLGALLADVPHTRPVQITGIAGDPDLVEKLGFSQTRYEGPTGIVGVLHNACSAAGMKSASLWAPVPHYVAAVASPKAALALLTRLGELLDVRLDTEELEQAAEEYEQRLDEAVAREPEVKQLVERLEQQLDEQEISFGDLPSGDSIAREFQRFLRDQADE
jgi:proteasome assembly chaperone (PAC2) family protein